MYLKISPKFTPAVYRFDYLCKILQLRKPIKNLTFGRKSTIVHSYAKAPAVLKAD